MQNGMQMDVGDLISVGVGLVVFFAIFGALVPTVVQNLNLTYYSEDGGSGTPNLTDSDLSSMEQMRTWYFVGGMLLVIAVIAGAIMKAF